MGTQETSSGETIRAGADIDLVRFLEGSMDLLAVTDFATVPLALSRSWERLLGWPLAELIEMPLIELVHPDDLEFASSELGTLLTGQPTNPSDLRLRCRDGSYRWLQASASSVLERGRIYLTATDIAARKDLEEALRVQMSLEELVASIAARLIAAVGSDVKRVIRTSLGELAELLGADRAHFIRSTRRLEDATYVEWRHPEHGVSSHTPDPDPVVQAWWQELIRSGTLLVLEDVETLAAEAPEVVASLRADRVKSVVLVPLPRQRQFWGFLALVAIREEVCFSPAVTSMLSLAGEAFFAALAQDDTSIALLDARRELEHRNDALEQSNEGLERFAYAAAHDLRAPLSKVEMALSVLEPGSRPEPLAIARRASVRMRRLIDDLLAFSEVSRVTGPGERVELDAVLDEVLGDLVDADDPAPKGDVTIERGPLPAVIGHRTLLGQLLQNLVGNALKFRRDEAACRIKVSAEDATDGGVTITVADDGIGIPAEHRESVFDAFKRLHSDDRFSGSGIGLASCAKVVDVHNGRIWVDDGIDGGTAVRVWLPSSRLADG